MFDLPTLVDLFGGSDVVIIRIQNSEHNHISYHIYIIIVLQSGRVFGGSNWELH